MTDAWRPVVAALADEVRRLVWARIVTGAADDSPVAVSALSARERRAVGALERAGLVQRIGDSALPVDAFGRLLPHRPAATGVDRFLRDGRIAAWPKRPADRAELLAWAGERALAGVETADEPSVTERLAAIADDPVTLRRDLVDAGLLERETDGSAYRRATRARTA